MSKRVVLLLIAVLAVSSLVMVCPVLAQSTTKPFVPEFTVELADHSYVVPETTSVDPYTGDEIIHPSYTVENKTIEITIKNQPSVAGLSYNVRTKGYFEENWTELFYYDESGGSGLPIQSTSGDTVISISQNKYPTDSIVDFQVEAVIVTRHLLYPDYPNLSYLAYWSYETSGWSNPQTIFVGESQTPTPSLTTTSSPTNYTEAGLTAVIIGVIIVVAVIAAGLSLLVYLIKRK